MKTIRREYKGSAKAAQKKADRDKNKLIKKGFEPTNQLYTPGRWTGGQFFVALLLCLLIVGLFIFVYMLIVKPAGTLTVTYQKGEAKITCPQCAEDIKAAANVCRFCGHQIKAA